MQHVPEMHSGHEDEQHMWLAAERCSYLVKSGSIRLGRCAVAVLPAAQIFYHWVFPVAVTVVAAWIAVWHLEYRRAPRSGRPPFTLLMLCAVVVYMFSTGVFNNSVHISQVQAVCSPTAISGGVGTTSVCDHIRADINTPDTHTASTRIRHISNSAT